MGVAYERSGAWVTQMPFVLDVLTTKPLGLLCASS